MRRNPGDWNSIAAYVNKPAHSCSSRWYSYLRSVVEDDIKQGPWTAEEVQLQ